MKILKDLYPGNLELTRQDVQFLRDRFVPDGFIVKEGLKAEVYIVSTKFLKEMKEKNFVLYEKLFPWVNCMFAFGPSD